MYGTHWKGQGVCVLAVVTTTKVSNGLVARYFHSVTARFQADATGTCTIAGQGAIVAAQGDASITDSIIAFEVQNQTDEQGQTSSALQISVNPNGNGELDVTVAWMVVPAGFDVSNLEEDWERFPPVRY